MIVRRARFGDDPSTAAPVDNLDIHVQPRTAVTGLALWVTAGVLTHVAIRVIDGWLDGRATKKEG